MPITCNNGLVNSVINECANLFTEGRCPPGEALAIVLHEYDGILSQLDAEHQQQTLESERMCHTSFHFGIGNNGTVHQYVEIDDTAWSFPVDWATNPECGVGSWLIAQGNPGVDPNCYTINIAITTGQVGVGNRTEPRTENKYSLEQINAVIDLVCCLVANNGVDIEIDTNTVWRHFNELSDFPGCRVKTPSGDVAVFGDVLTCIQNCIDTTSTGIPSGAMHLCDVIESLLPAGDNPTQGPQGVDFIDSGSDQDGNVLNNTVVEMSVNNLTFGKQFISGFNAASIRIDQSNINNQFCISFDRDQTNLRLQFGSIGDIAADRLSGFNVLPDSVDGDLTLNAGIVTGAGQGIGNIVWNNLPANTEICFTYDATNPLSQEEQILLMSIQSDEIFDLVGSQAIPGVTELIGADCRTYTIPSGGSGEVDFSALTTEQISDLCTVVTANCLEAVTNEIDFSTLTTEQISDFCTIVTTHCLGAITNEVDFSALTTEQITDLCSAVTENCLSAVTSEIDFSTLTSEQITDLCSVVTANCLSTITNEIDFSTLTTEQVSDLCAVITSNCLNTVTSEIDFSALTAEQITDLCAVVTANCLETITNEIDFSALTTQQITDLCAVVTANCLDAVTGLVDFSSLTTDQINDLCAVITANCLSSVTELIDFSTLTTEQITDLCDTIVTNCITAISNAIDFSTLTAQQVTDLCSVITANCLSTVTQQIDFSTLTTEQISDLCVIVTENCLSTVTSLVDFSALTAQQITDLCNVVTANCLTAVTEQVDFSSLTTQQISDLCTVVTANCLATVTQQIDFSTLTTEQITDLCAIVTDNCLSTITELVDFSTLTTQQVSDLCAVVTANCLSGITQEIDFSTLTTQQISDLCTVVTDNCLSTVTDNVDFSTLSQSQIADLCAVIVANCMTVITQAIDFSTLDPGQINDLCAIVTANCLSSVTGSVDFTNLTTQQISDLCAVIVANCMDSITQAIDFSALDPGQIANLCQTIVDNCMTEITQSVDFSNLTSGQITDLCTIITTNCITAVSEAIDFSNLTTQQITDLCATIVTNCMAEITQAIDFGNLTPQQQSDLCQTIADNCNFFFSGLIDKTMSPSFPGDGDTVTFTINYEIVDTDGSANAYIFDTLPTDLVLVSATSTSGVVTINGQDLEVEILSPSAGDTGTVTITATKSGTGSSVNSASLAFGTSNTVNATVAVSTIETEGSAGGGPTGTASCITDLSTLTWNDPNNRLDLANSDLANGDVVLDNSGPNAWAAAFSNETFTAPFTLEYTLEAPAGAAHLDAYIGIQRVGDPQLTGGTAYQNRGHYHRFYTNALWGGYTYPANHNAPGAGRFAIGGSFVNKLDTHVYTMMVDEYGTVTNYVDGVLQNRVNSTTGGVNEFHLFFQGASVYDSPTFKGITICQGSPSTSLPRWSA